MAEPDAPHDPSIFRRRGPAAIFTFVIDGPSDAAVRVFVDHSDGGVHWSDAGSLSLIGSMESSLHVSGLKELLRFRADVVRGAARLAALPPRWLPS